MAGDYATALQVQDKLMPLHKAIFTEPGLVGAKYAMSRLDLCSDEVRLPLTGLSDETNGREQANVDEYPRCQGLLTTTTHSCCPVIAIGAQDSRDRAAFGARSV